MQIVEIITNENALKAWLEGKPLEFAISLVARTALRVTPLLSSMLTENDQSERDLLVLPFFRVLSVINYLGAQPMRIVELRDTASDVQTEIHKAREVTNKAYEDIQISKVNYYEIGITYGEEIEDLGNKAHAISVASNTVDTAFQAVQAAVDAVDVNNGIASYSAVHEAVISAVTASIQAIDGVNGNTLDYYHPLDKEPEVAEHITDIWKAVSRDAGILELNNREETPEPEKLFAELSEMPLWHDRTPVWSSRHWAELKRSLPEREKWQVWIDWYEARLIGRVLDETLEFNRINIVKDDWIRGSSHVNTLIKRLIEARDDPVIVAISHSIEQMDGVKDLIDLREYMDRIRAAMPGDPPQIIGATKDMLEATMKTILSRHGHEVSTSVRFEALLNECLSVMGLRGTSPPSDTEKFHRTVASCAQKMIIEANKLRNRVGTGHGRVIGENAAITNEDASLVASTGMILCAWLLRHEQNIGTQEN